ncbi:MAG: class I SAM-dependent methyltransferase [Alphaproteobacteria bacterium]
MSFWSDSFKKELLKIKTEFNQELTDIKQDYVQKSDSNKDSWQIRKILFMAFFRFTPKNGSGAYVKELFDDYADNFETSLLDRLGYQSPLVISQMLKEATKKTKFKLAVDLGCGTGLMGQSLKENFNIKKLIGADISENMLKKAKEKKIYDELLEENLLTFVANLKKTSADLITITDALVYLGDLTELFKEASRVLVKKGFFCFDFELLEKKNRRQDFCLRKSARYAYNSDYVTAKLKEFNLVPVIYKEETIRYEYGRPVLGGYFIASKGA